MNILMISARADIGGGPRHVSDLTTTLSSDVRIFVACPDELPYSPLLQKQSHGYFEIPKRRFSILKALALWRFCRKNQIDIVHSHGRGAGTYSRFLGLLGYPVVHTFHGFHIHPSPKGRAILAVEKILAHLTRTFIAVSGGELERAVQAGVTTKEKTKLIFNGISSEKTVPDTRARTSSKIIFGSLTRFDPQKGNHLLIALLKGLKGELKDRFIVRLAGEGPELAHIQALVANAGLSETVELVGPVSAPDAFLESIDVFISASLGEGLSYATLEALRAGKPLLLSRVTGHTELHGIQGVLFFDLQSQAEFTEHLQSLLDKPLPTTTLPRQFSLSTMAQETLKTYHKILDP